nr:helix-turn-helix transcriptional regulator [Pedobacter suwonensis]
MLGVDASTVGSWEKGESIPSPNNLKGLESLLKKKQSNCI